MNSTYNCLSCDAECKWGRTKKNKYCNNTCRADYEYKHVHMHKILNGEKSEHSTVLRRYICERDENKCKSCGQNTTWNGTQLTLQMDHIDGNSDNNWPANLRLICPNCHSQTKNWGSKGRGNRYKKVTKRNLYLQEYKS